MSFGQTWKRFLILPPITAHIIVTWKKLLFKAGHFAGMWNDCVPSCPCRKPRLAAVWRAATMLGAARLLLIHSGLIRSRSCLIQECRVSLIRTPKWSVKQSTNKDFLSLAAYMHLYTVHSAVCDADRGIIIFFLNYWPCFSWEMVL